jgi:hypothetical protein
MPLLSEEKQHALVEFVNKGGKLIVLGATGYKNQYNLKNVTIPLLEAAKLSNYPKKESSISVGTGEILFIPLEIPKDKFLTKYEQKEGTFFGSSMVDIFADVPEAYTRDNINAELRKKLNSVAEESIKILKSNVTKMNENNSFVELSTMLKKDEHILVHLVNYNVTVDGDITPAKNISAQIVIPEGFSAKNIYYNGELGEMQNINYEIKEIDGNKLVSTTFPIVNIYGLAKIELEKSK